MGITMLQVEVGNPVNPDGAVAVQFIVDSGATYSVVPAPVLEGLGIRPLREEEFRLADVANGIFGEPGDSTLLGVLTLEALGYALDPLRRELKPLPMLLGVEMLAR